MLLQRFLNLIDHSAIGRFVARKEELIEQLDPSRIYVENVRSFFGVPSSIAQAWCELAVREGIFARRFGVLCPQCQRLILTVEHEDQIPDKIVCEVCERNECDRYEFARSEVATLVFYKLIA